MRGDEVRQYTREDIDFKTFYNPWMKSLAKTNTIAELEIKLYGAKKESTKAATSHLRAIERTHSMQGNSQSRAQTRNMLAAAGEFALALRGAIEIHELFPEEAKK